jgi:hypothetical protein
MVMWLRPVSTDPTTITEVEVDRARVEPPTGFPGRCWRSGRTRRDLADLGLADRSLAFPGMRAADVHPARVHPGDAGARQHGVSLRLALPVGEHVEALGPRTQRVGVLLRQVDEHVALADLEDFAVLPRDPGAAEDEEDLLLGTFGMRRGRPLAGVDPDALEADGARSRPRGRGRTSRRRGARPPRRYGSTSSQ